jgi:hypothetical protein
MSTKRKAWEYAKETRDAAAANAEHAVMDWAKTHAVDVKMRDVLALLALVRTHVEGHGRDMFEIGTNAKMIDEQAAAAA